MTQDKQEPRNPYPKLDVPYGTQYDGWQKCYSTMKPQIETLRAEIKATDIAHGEALEEIDRIEAENARLKEENKRLDIMLNVHDTALESQLKQKSVSVNELHETVEPVSKLAARPTEQAREKIAEKIWLEVRPLVHHTFHRLSWKRLKATAHDGNSNELHMKDCYEFADQILQLFPFPDEQGIAKRIFKDLDFAIRVGTNKFLFFKDDYNKIQDKYCKAGEPPLENQ